MPAVVVLPHRNIGARAIRVPISTATRGFWSNDTPLIAVSWCDISMLTARDMFVGSLLGG